MITIRSKSVGGTSSPFEACIPNSWKYFILMPTRTLNLSRNKRFADLLREMCEWIIFKKCLMSIFYTLYFLTKIYEIRLLENFIYLTVKLATNFRNKIPVLFFKNANTILRNSRSHSKASNCRINNAHLPAVSGRKLYRLDTPTIEDHNRLEFVAVSKVIRGQAVTCTVNTAVYSTTVPIIY